MFSSSTIRGIEGQRAAGTRENDKPMMIIETMGVNQVRPKTRWAGRIARPPNTTANNTMSGDDEAPI
jgi:hypothetical protein